MFTNAIYYRDERQKIFISHAHLTEHQIICESSFLFHARFFVEVEITPILK